MTIKNSRINANTSITSNVRNRAATSPVHASFDVLSPAQKDFVRQLRRNMSRPGSAITAATNTSNIMAKPDFLELLPLFVQKLYITDVFGTVAMKSRQQLIPYFKFIAENTKGETKRGDILNSPFVNRQGIDSNFGGRLVKNEVIIEGAATAVTEGNIMYTPLLPGSITLTIVGTAATTVGVDDGNGNILDAASTKLADVDYASGVVALVTGLGANEYAKVTYQYDNETVGPRGNANGDFGYDYGAQMGKGYLQLDEFNLVAEAHQLACYWSIYSAFAAQQEWGTNIGDMSKEAAFAELTAEINSAGFELLAKTASYKPQFDWDATPVLSGSVVPSDYLNMFKLKLGQAAASIYQATRLSRPNRLVVGTNTAEYISMINSFKADNIEDSVGPYKLGTLDQFDIYVDPNYDPNSWVMCCKSNDIRRNSALFGEYMPLTNTDPVGLANASVQQGYATMYATKVVNPDTVVSGKILGIF